MGAIFSSASTSASSASNVMPYSASSSTRQGIPFPQETSVEPPAPNARQMMTPSLERLGICVSLLTS